MEERSGHRPTAEEVIAKLKDDGDFDSLRLKIIRQIKENEKLRNSIIEEVKQSEILNKDGSDNLKPRQLSDAIYQELGKKLMGQISDEIWKVIRSEDTKADIRGTVESVYNRIVNPTIKEEDHRSPAKENSSKENGKIEPTMPPGVALSDELPNGGNKTKVKEEPHSDPVLSLPSEEELHHPNWTGDDMPPGFGLVASSPGINAHGGGGGGDGGGGGGGDLPPGFETGGSGGADGPPGFETLVVSGGGGGGGNDDDDPDPDLPPGFG